MSHQTVIILQAKQKKIESLEADEFCLELRQKLKEHDQIDTFCLSGNSYSDVFFSELAPYLAKMKSITRVILSDIFTTRKNEIIPALRALSSCLRFKKIQLLDFSSNALCPDGCLEIVDIIRTNPELKYLYLNHVALSEAGSVSISKAIVEGKLSLKSLQVIKNRIENAAPEIADAVSANSHSLEELIIYQNSIKGQGMQKLLEAISKCKHMQALDISDNLIETSHIDLLTEILHSTSGLKLLKLDDCNISANSSKKIFKVLKEMPNKNLEKFTFNYNDVEDLNELLEALLQHKGIKIIECKGNDADGVRTDHMRDVDILLESFDCSDECSEEHANEEEKIANLIKEIRELKID